MTAAYRSGAVGPAPQPETYVRTVWDADELKPARVGSATGRVYSSGTKPLIAQKLELESFVRGSRAPGTAPRDPRAPG